ncbi:MAG TPA: hypothetical protein VNF72_14165 [Myxococcota bacterium]|jgi:hypothetical protein|nr:hypothetical protein [Myxococcota bacterium]
MKLSTLAGGLSLLAMLLLASPGVRVEPLPAPAAAHGASALASAPR